MSGFIEEKFWSLNNYRYVFYRWIVEFLCHRTKYHECLMLDAGCGKNGCSLWHVPENVEVVGVDINRESILQSKKCRCDFAFVAASLSLLPFRDGVFGLVVCLDVLEHVEHRGEAIKEIARVTCRKGKVVASTSNKMNPCLMFDSYMPSRIVYVVTSKFAPGHYERHKRFSPSSLLKAFNNENFETEWLAVGFPPFSSAIYNYTSAKAPFYADVWIAYDKLTCRKPFIFMKETMVIEAVKA